MANLFAAANQLGPKPLVSFRAGKMFKEGSMVKPDKRKGLINLVHTDDMLIHFQWKDRYTGAVEEDLVIFPDEAVFSRVEKCTTGRVYMLDFKGTSRQLFYWLQEPKEDKDEENCKKINEFINHPPPFRGGGGGAEATTGQESNGAATGPGGAAGMLGQLDRNQLMGLLAGLSGNAATAPAAAAAAAAQVEPLSMHHVLDAGEVSSIAQANVEEFVDRLSEHLPPLPEGVSREEHLMENLRSSQLRQTVSLFESALADPQAYSEIMTSFGLPPPSSDGPGFGPHAFLNAIAHSVAQQQPPAAAAAAAAKDDPMEVVKEEPASTNPQPPNDAGEKKEDKMEE